MKNTLKNLLLLSILISLSACSSSRSMSEGSNPSIKKEKKLGEIVFEGGDGSSAIRAVIITKAKNSYQGIQAETVYLEKMHGIRNLEWQLISQELHVERTKTYDIITIKKIASKEEVNVYFDITDFYGKF